MTATGKQYATFWLGSSLYGIEVTRVREVLREQSITRVPLAPPTVAGLINLRGQVVTTIDLHPRLVPTGRRSAESMLVVVFAGGESVALLVDRIGGVVDVTDDQFEPPPDTLVGAVRELVSGAYKLDGQLLLSLDVDAAVAT
ncbi:MAG: chemotaxis protein CheW [Actinobacteria bacterium 69-20]|nr:chemotaxis protein CheW [Actinomycetota bacterium]OJV31278.1 MAG: chemotaxis protein CheW [Actinobacteria bacterium 69-20]